MKGDRKFAPLFEVVSIDAWAEGEDGWTWNQKFPMFQFRSNASDLKRAFVTRLRRYLKEKMRNWAGQPAHIELGRGWYYITDDWDIMELKKRCNDEPMYACMRLTPSH